MMDVERVNAYMERVVQSETKTFKPVSDKLKVGLDLGTAYIVLVVLDEESASVISEKEGNDVFVNPEDVINEYINEHIAVDD